MSTKSPLFATLEHLNTIVDGLETAVTKVETRPKLKAGKAVPQLDMFAAPAPSFDKAGVLGRIDSVMGQIKSVLGNSQTSGA